MSSNPFAKGAKAFGFTGSEAPTEYWTKYEQPDQKGSSKGPIPTGRYTFQIPEPGENFYPDEAKGDNATVTFIMHIPVVGPSSFAGREVRYARISARKQPWREGSLAGDLLIACGLSATPKTADEWFSIAPFLAGKRFDADVDWSLFDKGGAGSLYRRAADFPKKLDGTPMSIVILYPDGTPVQPKADETFEQQRAKEEAAIAAGGRKLFANVDFKRIYPAA